MTVDWNKRDRITGYGNLKIELDIPGEWRLEVYFYKTPTGPNTSYLKQNREINSPDGCIYEGTGPTVVVKHIPSEAEYLVCVVRESRIGLWVQL